MQTLTEIVAAVVLHSSAAAYSHFGVTLDAPTAEKPAAAAAPVARSVARTAPGKVVKPADHLQHAADCPKQAHARLLRT